MNPHAPVLSWVLRTDGARLGRLSCKPSKLDSHTFCTTSLSSCMLATLQQLVLLDVPQLDWSCRRPWSLKLDPGNRMRYSLLSLCSAQSDSELTLVSGTSGEVAAVETDSMASVAVMPTDGAVCWNCGVEILLTPTLLSACSYFFPKVTVAFNQGMSREVNGPCVIGDVCDQKPSF